MSRSKKDLLKGYHYEYHGPANIYIIIYIYIYTCLVYIYNIYIHITYMYESGSKWLKTILVLQEFFVRDVHETLESRMPPNSNY